MADMARPSAAELAYDEEPGPPLLPAGNHALRRAHEELGLDPVEAEALLVLLAAHLEPRYRALYAVLSDNRQAEPPLTDRLLFTVLGRTPERRRILLESLAPGGRLIETGLVISSAGAHPPLERPLDLAPEVRGALLGFSTPRAALGASIEWQSLATPASSSAPRFFVVFGSGEWLDEIDRAGAAPRGRMFVAAPENVAQAASLWRLGALHDALPVLDLKGLDAATERAVAAEAHRLVETYGGRAAVVARRPIPIAAPQRAAPIPSFTDRCRAWQTEALRRGVELSDAEAARLASAFRLGARAIAQAFDAAFALTAEALAEAAARLLHLPVRHGVLVPATHTFADLVVRESTRAALERLVHFARHRDRLAEELDLEDHFRLRRGPIVLFSGQSGTGKTLSAEIVARELGRPLYVVELSQLVSKYIGETEKNIEQVLTEAERAEVVLFFDEADALFSARTESVSSSNDRYANLEVGYLLQRIERHEGLVILATNLRNAIDEAFLRRFHFRVEFPLPEAGERRAIWEQMIPDRLRRATELDLSAVARAHRLSGGEIRNVALKAIFLAEQEGAPLAQAHVERAVATELLEMGRLARRPTERAMLDRGALLRELIEALERIVDEHLRARFAKEIFVIHGAPTKEGLAGKRPAVSIAVYRMTAPKAGSLRVGLVLSTWSHRPVEEHELLGAIYDALWARSLDSIGGRKATLRVQESYDFDLLHRFWSSHGHPVRASLVVDGEIG
ncbi:Cell division protein FtsH [Minicystis rosea]|nr:Cell division protein FtsH [Minicystis rosea]